MSGWRKPATDFHRRLDVAAAVVASSLLLICGCGGGMPAAPVGQATPAPSSPAGPKVVIMSIDGLRSDVAQEGATFQSLAAKGAYTWQARTITPSNTLPAHVSMLTGYIPAVHNVTWDDYVPTAGKITVASIFTTVHAAGMHGAMIVGKEKFYYFRDTGAVDTFILSGGGDDDIANQAVVQIQAGVDFLFVHFPDVDITGHAKQWLSTDYRDRFIQADRAAGRIVAALPPSTTVILTADHGGHLVVHGTTQREDMTIPWVIAGPRIRHGQITVTVNTTDTAVTATHLMGLVPPRDVQGRVVTEALLPVTAAEDR